MRRHVWSMLAVLAILAFGGCSDGDGGGGSAPQAGPEPTPAPPPGEPAPAGAPPELRLATLTGPWSGPEGSYVEVDGAIAERLADGTWRVTVAIGADGGTVTVRVIHEGRTLATRVVTVTPAPIALASR